MDFDLYGDDSGAILKLDPRTKMLLFLASSILSINSYNDLAIFAFNTALCAVLALCGKRATALKGFVAFGVMLFLRHCIEMQGTGAPAVVMVCQAILTIFVFSFPVVISILMLVQTTRISQFLAAFQAMHLPAQAVIPVAVMFRFFPTVRDEWEGINKAMAFRGIRMDLISVLRRPFQAIEHLLVPLLVSSVSVMEELAAASLARGLDADHERTSYEEVRMRAADYVVIVVFGVLAFFVFTGGLIGGGA